MIERLVVSLAAMRFLAGPLILFTLKRLHRWAAR